MSRPTPRSAFTILEAVFLMSLIVLVYVIVLVNIQGRQESAKVLQARKQISEFAKAMELFRKENGFYPTTAEGLDALVQRPERSKYWPEGGFIKGGQIPRDPWGNLYVYRSPGEQSKNFEILSNGADGKPGGKGFDRDIASYDSD